MDRITEKDKNGKYYIVEEKICIGTEQINPIKTWITENENRGYGKPIDKLGELEDLMQSYSVEDLEELNKLLGMATTYEELSKQAGCPLEMVSKLFRQEFVYFKYPANVQIMKVKVCKGLYYGSNLGWYFTGIYDNLDFIYISLRDHKVTWWLKADRSE